MVTITYRNDAGENRTISFDAAISEGHVQTSRVTEHGVERGANIADHVRADNPRFTVEVFVTNSPIRQPGSHTRGAGSSTRALDLNQNGRLNNVGSRVARGALAGLASVSEPVGLQASASTFQMDGKIDRVQDVYTEISAVVDTGTVVVIATSLRTYEDMVLGNLSVPRSAENGNAIKFTFEAVRIRLVETQRVQAPAQALRPRNRGPQAATEVDAKKEPRKQSLLKGGAEEIKRRVSGVFGGFGG